MEPKEVFHYIIRGWSPTLESSKLVSVLAVLTDKIQTRQKDVGAHPVTIMYRLVKRHHTLHVSILFV